MKSLRNGPKGNKGMCGKQRPVLEPNAAGIDVGATEMFVAVNPDRDPEPVRVFDTFTSDLEALVEWLKGCGVVTVAMESTGVYWIPLYQMLEQAGLQPCLVNARHLKNVPGRRTDWHDCQWLQYLHSVGLLRAAFRPTDSVCAVRSVWRHRAEMVAASGQHVQHMQKAMIQMNLQLQHVISDITGVTGLAIIDAILRGERHPDQLAKLRERTIKADEATIRKSLVGSWQREHLFVLAQSRAMYEAYRQQILACDREIEVRLKEFEPAIDPEQKPLPSTSKRQRKIKRTAGAIHFDYRTEAYKLFGVDLTRVPGMESSVLSLFTEIGRDLSRFPTSDHFGSWCGLCPDNDKSGGRVLWRGVRRIQQRVGQIFRLAAHSLHRSDTRLGDFLRRMKFRLGAKAATTATAHKIATIVYTLITKQVQYDDSIWKLDDERRNLRLVLKLKKQASALGFTLLPAEVP